MARCTMRALSAVLLLCSLGIHGEGSRKVVGQVTNPFIESQPKAPVYDGEDAAAAAQRLAAEHNVWDSEPIIEAAKAFKAELSGQDGFSSPKDLILKTGGAYIRRAEEAIKAKKFGEGASDCLRALMRPGLDPTATEPMTKKLEHALLRMQRIREMAEEDARQEEEKYAAQRSEADALAKDWKVLIDEDEEFWRAIDKSNATTEGTSAARKEVYRKDLELKTPDGTTTKSRLSVREGEDASHAVFEFCAVNNIHTVEQVAQLRDTTHQELAKLSYAAPAHLKLPTGAEHLQKGKAHQEDFELSQAGAHFARGLQAGGVSEEEQEELSKHLVETLRGYKASQVFLDAWKKKDYNAVIAALKDVPASLRSDLVQLMLARAYGNVGKMKEAISAITSLLNQCDKSGDWHISEPRLLAAISGAILALRIGDIDKAKRIYQIVLRNDPEQKHIKQRYKVLRQFMKILNDIEELLNHSKNHDVVRAVERTTEMLQKVLGKEGSVNAGTRLLLFECKAKSAMTFHDDAIEACNTAIQQFSHHDNPDPRRIAEAYAWRAEANRRDNSFDDEVSDLQMALQHLADNKPYQEALRAAEGRKTEWNESEEQHDPRTGESLGSFYSNRPMYQMLDLPDNIDELEKDAKCKWLKSSFRKMSLRWHPDKAKGGAKRAQRKSAEISEGKTFLELKFGCKRSARSRR